MYVDRGPFPDAARLAPAVDVYVEPIENRAFHDLLVTPDGGANVAWCSYRQDMPENPSGAVNTEVRIASSTDSGVTFGPSFQVDDLACMSRHTSPALARDGTLYLGRRDQVPQTDDDVPIRNHVVARRLDGGLSLDEPTLMRDDAWRVGQCTGGKE